MLPTNSGEPCRTPADSEKPGTHPSPNDHDKCDVDKALDETLEQTFPASDPPSTVPGPCAEEEDDSQAA
jgi:hypothetical protein